MRRGKKAGRTGLLAGRIGLWMLLALLGYLGVGAYHGAGLESALASLLAFCAPR